MSYKLVTNYEKAQANKAFALFSDNTCQNALLVLCALVLCFWRIIYLGQYSKTNVSKNFCLVVDSSITWKLSSQFNKIFWFCWQQSLHFNLLPYLDVKQRAILQPIRLNEFVGNSKSTVLEQKRFPYIIHNTRKKHLGYQFFFSVEAANLSVGITD